MVCKNPIIVITDPIMVVTDPIMVVTDPIMADTWSNNVRLMDHMIILFFSFKCSPYASLFLV
jgi:hypothetical protein